MAAERNAAGGPASDALDDAALLDAFVACTLSHDVWDHAAHVRVAWLHLERLPFDRAVDAVRAGILRLNDAHGVPSTPTGGYHETITVAFMHVVDEVRRSDRPAPDARSFVQRRAEALAPARLFDHYSKERLGSDEARTTFVMPDRAPLPVSARSVVPRRDDDRSSATD